MALNSGVFTHAASSMQVLECIEAIHCKQLVTKTMGRAHTNVYTKLPYKNSGFKVHEY